MKIIENTIQWLTSRSIKQNRKVEDTAESAIFFVLEENTNENTIYNRNADREIFLGRGKNLNILV